MSYLDSAFPAVVNTTDFDLIMYNRIVNGITALTAAMGSISDQAGNIVFSRPAYASIADGEWFTGGNVLQGGTDDISVSILFRAVGSGVRPILTTQNAPDSQGYILEIFAVGLEAPMMMFTIDDGVDSFSIWGTAPPTTGTGAEWHRVDVVIDRSDVSKCTIFFDGVYDTGGSDGATALAAVGDIDNANDFVISGYDDGSGSGALEVRDARIYIAAGAHWTDGHIRFHYANPRDFGAGGGTYTAYWPFDDAPTAANADGDGMITDGSGGGFHLDAGGGDTTNYATHSRVGIGIEFGSVSKLTWSGTNVEVDYLEVLDDPWTFGTLAPAGDCTVSNDATVDVGGTLTLSGNLSVVGVIEVDTITGTSFTIAQIPEPSDPPDEHAVMWCSNGTGIGDVGDIMVKIQHGSVVKSTTLVNFV